MELVSIFVWNHVTMLSGALQLPIHSNLLGRPNTLIPLYDESLTVSQYE